MWSCEYWEIFKNIYFEERLLLFTVSYFGENDENKHIYVYIT